MLIRSVIRRATQRRGERRGKPIDGVTVKNKTVLFLDRFLRTGEEISGARFHRAEHVGNVLHVRATTVILAPALSNLFHRKIVQLDGRTLLEEVDGHQQVVLPPPLQDQTLDASQGSILNPHLRSRL